jgi:hypothetical protein
LLFIVLFSAPPRDEKGKSRDIPTTGSPSKMTRQQQKSTYIPTYAARDAAVRLLASFAITNTPNALLRGLPSYPGPDDDSTDNIGDDDPDSFIARESLRLKDGRGCWSTLNDGFYKRGSSAMMATSPKKSDKKRRHDSFEDDELSDAFDSAESFSVVAENAWPVLDWLIMVFERDEAMTENKALRASFFCPVSAEF